MEITNEDERKGQRWSVDEDDLLRSLITQFGSQRRKWLLIAERIPGRSETGCRVRWSQLQGKRNQPKKQQNNSPSSCTPSNSMSISKPNNKKATRTKKRKNSFSGNDFSEESEDDQMMIEDSSSDVSKNTHSRSSSISSDANFEEVVGVPLQNSLGNSSNGMMIINNGSSSYGNGNGNNHHFTNNTTIISNGHSKRAKLSDLAAVIASTAAYSSEEDDEFANEEDNNEDVSYSSSFEQTTNTFLNQFHVSTPPTNSSSSGFGISPSSSFSKYVPVGRPSPVHLRPPIIQVGGILQQQNHHINSNHMDSDDLLLSPNNNNQTSSTPTTPSSASSLSINRVILAEFEGRKTLFEKPILNGENLKELILYSFGLINVLDEYIVETEDNIKMGEWKEISSSTLINNLGSCIRARVLRREVLSARRRLGLGPTSAFNSFLPQIQEEFA